MATRLFLLSAEVGISVYSWKNQTKEEEKMCTFFVRGTSFQLFFLLLLLLLSLLLPLPALPPALLPPPLPALLPPLPAVPPALLQSLFLPPPSVSPFLPPLHFLHYQISLRYVSHSMSFIKYAKKAESCCACHTRGDHLSI